MTRRSVVVLGILAIVVLIALAIPLMRPLDTASNPIQARQDIKAIETGLDIHRKRFGAYPTDAEGLPSLEKKKILSRVVPDPWGNHYHFRCPGSHHPDGCDVWSYGADGRAGGAGYDRDVTNWDQ